MKILMKHSTELLVCLLTILLSSNGIAQVYKSTDEQGNVTFSDTPDADADEIQLPVANTAEAIDVPPKLEVIAEETDRGYILEISSPANDGVIANGLVGFTVTTDIRPKLNKNHQLQLSIDGKVHSHSQGTFQVDSIERGPHSLQVTLIDENGVTLAQSSSINVFAYRPSTSDSGRNNRPSIPPRPTPKSGR
jgi:hypothetical protein